MKTKNKIILKAQIWIIIVIGLILITFGAQFTSASARIQPGLLAMDPPESQAMIDTANDVAATFGWPESATVGTYQGREYVTLRHTESSGGCSFTYFVVIGEWELSSGARRGTSTINFHGYEASRKQSEDGSLDGIWWQARVEFYAEVSSYDCPPADAMPLAETLYAAAERNGLLDETSPPTQTVGPTIAQATLTVSVENGYTAIASDGESELIIQATVTGPMSGEDVYWTVTNLDSGEDITQQLSPYDADAHNALMIYKPEETYPEPFTADVRATIFIDQDEISDSVQIRVVRPPVILVHGIWSDSSAMLPLEQAISLSDSMFGTRVSRVDYSTPSSYSDMTQKVDVLGAEVDEALASLNSFSTKVSRVDIVAHSMGGLISRLYLLDHTSNVRKLITLATPHNGTPFANWYHELVENGLQSCPPVSVDTYTPQLPTKDELYWFLTLLRNSMGLRSDALQYGEAVQQLQTIETDASIPHLLSGYAQPGSVQYYFLAGADPFISRDNADRLAGWVHQIYPFNFNSNNPGACGQTTLSPGLETMIDEFFSHISTTGTDGVVPLDSARGYGLSAREVAIIHANHFSIVGNPQTTDAMLRYLTDQRAKLEGTLINTNSPGHLHVYDHRGNHVGIDASGNVEVGIEGASYQLYVNTTGDHESIWVPPGVEGIWFEFMADEEGTVGLEIGHGMDDDLHFFSYLDIEVQPGSTVTIQANPTDPEGQISHPDGQTMSLSPTLSDIGYVTEGTNYSSDESSTPSQSKLNAPEILLLCLCGQGWVLLAAGLIGIIILRRKQPENKNPLLILGIALVVLTTATCLLGAYLIFADGPSDGATSQGRATTEPSPILEIPLSSPEPLSQATSEPPQTSMAELTVFNETNDAICYVFISSVESDDWGEDWLGSDKILSPSDSHTFYLPDGTYNLAVLDCADRILAEEYDIDISGMMEWIIED